MTDTTYTKQAEDFLTRNNLKIRISLSDSKTATWEPAGHHYRVTLTKQDNRIVFDFWGSVNDMQHTVDPNAYDVLSCISGDVYIPEKFEDFCSEYDYELDSIKSLQTFKRCDGFAKRLRDFFTADEIDQLSEIQ